MQKVKLVLSGGGVRGIAHLGVLKLLDELDIAVSAISGTSSGAIMGAFYAEGYKPDEILEIAKQSKLFGFSNIHFGKAGIFDMKPFETVYKNFFSHNLLESLRIPLTVNATDIVNGETVYFNSGDLSLALMASSCVPLVFEPVQYKGSIFLDGGIMNNFPIEPLLGSKNLIVGVHVNSLSRNIEEIHMKDMLDRSFHFAVNADVKLKSKKCDIFIEAPDMSRFGMFDLALIDEIFKVGYSYAKSMQDELLNAVKSK